MKPQNPFLVAIFLKKYDTFVEKITVYNHINETLKMYFDVEQEYFDNVLNEMVDKEYICYDNKDTFNLKKLIWKNWFIVILYKYNYTFNVSTDEESFYFQQ